MEALNSDEFKCAALWFSGRSWNLNQPVWRRVVMKIEELSAITNANHGQALKAGAPSQLTNNAGAKSSSAAPGGSVNDTLSISPRAERLAKLSAQIAAMPDIRQSRVDSLRQSATSGAFNPSSSDIAGGIINAEARVY
jgi:flagellar biosynthesis anti-sigma factor FlgM